MPEVYRQGDAQIPDDATPDEMREVLQLLAAAGRVQGIDITAAFERVRAARAQVTAMATTASTEIQSPSRVSLIDAADFLEIDIDAIIKKTLETHQLWGLPKAFARAGVVKNPGEYEELLRTATTRKDDLPRIRKEDKSRVTFTPLIVPPISKKFGLVQLWNTIFDKLPHDKSTYALKNLSLAQQLDPHDIPQLRELSDSNEMERRRVSEIWKGMFDKKDQPATWNARLVFTPNSLEPTRCSGLRDMQMALDGQRYLDPAAHWLYVIQKLTDGISTMGSQQGDFSRGLSEGFRRGSIDRFIPDREKMTRYPDIVLPDGSVLCFDWDQDGRVFCLRSHRPGDTDALLASRIAIG